MSQYCEGASQPFGGLFQGAHYSNVPALCYPPDLRRGYREEPRAYTGIPIIDGAGLTCCVVLCDKRLALRNCHVHGFVITGEVPTYLGQAAVLRSSGALHDWVLGSEVDHEDLLDGSFCGDFWSGAGLAAMAS